MRALFTSALLAVGAFASNSKYHGAWDMIGDFSIKQGDIGMTTTWSKSGGADSVVEIKYAMEVTREQVMKDNANTQKLSLWWPNAAADAAEYDVIYMKAPGSAWEYKYGTVASYDNSDGGIASVTAAADPSDIYRFVWSSADP